MRAFMDRGIHVSFIAEHIGTLGSLPLTNTLLMSWVVVALVGIFVFLCYSRLVLRPRAGQVGIELFFGSIFTYVEETLESTALARRYFPLLSTIFIFIFLANLLEFFPGVGSIGVWQYHEGERVLTPLLRSMNTDLNMTIAIALISFLAIELSGILTIGFFKYGSRFLNFHSFVGFFVGIIEFFSELIRLISFSFRLFGNIFAGEVLLVVVASFVPYFLPVPFMLFEVFVGFMQAAIFSLLTLFFIKMAITEPEH